MAVEQSREATFGILTYLLLGAAVGASALLGTFFLGIGTIGDLIGAALHDGIVSGDAHATLLLAFFVAAPFFALVVAALMGVRAARTGNEIPGQAAATTLFGLPILWANLAIGLLLSSALLDWAGDGSSFDTVFDLVVESILFLIFATGASVAFAAILAGITRDAFLAGAPTPHGAHEHLHEDPRPLAPPRDALPEVRTPSPAPEAAPPEPRPLPQGNRLDDHPVECPRCHTHFTVSGERPLRIECPDCGKTGTIR